MSSSVPCAPSNSRLLAGALRFEQQARHVGHHRLDAIGERQRLVERLLEIDRLGAEVLAQHEVVEVEHLAQLGGEALAVKQVLQADRAARDLVLVGRADAAAGGADLARALGRLARVVERRVVGQDQRTGLAERQPRAHLARRRAPACRIPRSSACGETTTPLPMKQATPSRRMPEGIRCSTVFLPPITSVWPALWPPWKRTTPWAWSVSQSTILPLPSSPHWVPTTTTLRAIRLSASHSLLSRLRLQRGYLPPAVRAA